MTTPTITPPYAAPRAAVAASMLASLADLFERLHADEVRYCHWKSNEHLGASLIADSDLDLLVDRRSALPLARTLAAVGAKRFQVRPGRGYPGIEDFLLFDRPSGRLVHLHLHYQLTLGEKLLKGHRLPWEETLLATRAWDARHGVWVTDPHLELLLLLARAAMKLRMRDRLLEAASAAYVRGSTLREMRWLVERVEAARLEALAAPLVGRRAASMLSGLADGHAPTIRELRRLRDACEPPLGEFRMYAPADALRRRWSREVATVWGVARNRLVSPELRASTRTPPQGGIVVALVGGDGAGKSSIAREVVRWLSREACVLPIYGGSGDGSASPARLAVQGASRVLRSIRGALRDPRDAAARSSSACSSDHGREMPSDASLPRMVGGALWALALAREQRARARRARRARDLGAIVVCDRLPQTQFPGIGDGPRLSRWRESPHAVKRALSRREQDAYRTAALTPPELVIKLHVSTAVALMRKPETPRARLDRKLEVVRELRFPATTRVVDVDADRPFPEVVLDVKRAIWDAI